MGEPNLIAIRSDYQKRPRQTALTHPFAPRPSGQGQRGDADTLSVCHCPPGAPHLAPLLLPGQAPGRRALALSRPAAGTARAPPRQGPQMSSPPRGASRSQRSQGPDSTGRRRPRPLPARPEGSSPLTPEPGSCPPKARRSLESFHSLSLSLGTRGARARGGKAAVSAPTWETTGRGGGRVPGRVLSPKATPPSAPRITTADYGPRAGRQHVQGDAETSPGKQRDPKAATSGRDTRTPRPSLPTLSLGARVETASCHSCYRLRSPFPNRP